MKKAFAFMMMVEEKPWRCLYSGMFTDSIVSKADNPEDKERQINEFKEKFERNPQVIAIKKYNEENK